MLVKLDENLGKSHADLLNRAGHAADRVYDQGLSGASDDDVWQRVTAEQRLLVTLDLDFADVRKYPVGSHPGILLLRPRNRSRQATTGILERVLNDHSLEDFRGCLVVADEFHTRIRHPARDLDDEN